MDLTAWGTPAGLQRNVTLNRESAAALGVMGALTAGASLWGARWTTSPARSWRGVGRSTSPRRDGVTGPAWTLMSALLAVSAWRVWGSAAGPARSRALMWWGAQLGLHLSGPWGGGRRAPAARVERALRLGSAVAYTVSARQVDARAPLLMAPVLGWVGFSCARRAARMRRPS
ncbi:tryptophan-rich sensory protein [Corallococcus sp. H22C18031201]|nr:tryptophan-rich sensory protein [Corallococcus sp. H22C18031201]